MEKIFDLKKYSNLFDKNRNAVLAFKQAQTMLMLKKTFRKPVIVFLSSGISNSSDPYDISQILKTLLNVRIITISTTATTEVKIDRIASLGMNIATTNNEKAAEESFEKILAFANCYCKSGWIQFIDSKDSTSQTSYYGDCLRGFSNAETPASAFNICKSFGGVPISLTSAEKSKFVSTSIIYEQINKSPIFTIGLKRHSTNINLKTWTHFSGEDFSTGEFPTHLSQISNDDLSLNCTMALQIGHQTFFSPIGCSSSKLPFICQIPAFDGNRQEIKN
uniref:C-type lectin domain-containing protein n=1 Tax=Panagrolaimus davidi TaxID=227884 RepID=A0A914PN48_9BILA